MEERKDIGSIALLVDVENISPKYTKHIFDELANWGVVTYKRAYTDWTGDQRENWKAQLLEYAITPVQQYSYTYGKNSSDSALIIDAMDIMHAKNVKGFCIVSSDSDFIRLVTRLREEGIFVIGMGEEKTSKTTVSAYDRFIYLDVLFGKNGKEKQNTDNHNVIINRNQNVKAAVKKMPAIGKIEKIDAADKVKNKIPNGFLEEVTSIIDSWSNDEGWANLANVGNMLVKRNPDFDSRNYGFKKLNDMIKNVKELETRVDVDKKIYYVKIKESN
jgi:uncharacterized LabA/DUF88 family protein